MIRVNNGVVEMSSNGETTGQPAQKGNTLLLWLPILGLCGWLGYLMLQPTTVPVAIELESADRELLNQLEVASSLVSPKAIIRDQEAQVAVAYLSPPMDAVPAIQPPQAQHSLLLPPSPMPLNEPAPAALPRKVEVKMNAPKRLRIAIASPMATTASAPVLQPPVEVQVESVKPEREETLVSAPALKQPLVQMQFGSIEPPPRLNTTVGLVTPPSIPVSVEESPAAISGESLPQESGRDDIETLAFSSPGSVNAEHELEALTFEPSSDEPTSDRRETGRKFEEVSTLPALIIAPPVDLSWEKADRLPEETLPWSQPSKQVDMERGLDVSSEASAPAASDSVRAPELGPQTLASSSRPLPPLTRETESATPSKAVKPGVQRNPYTLVEDSEATTSNRKLSDRRVEESQPTITLAETPKSLDASTRTERKLQDHDSTNAQYLGAIQLQHRNGQTIELPQAVRRIVVADETICEVIRISEHEISLIGSKVGGTTVAIITEDGLEWKLDVEVKVSAHSAPSVSGKNLKELQATINRMHRETRIDIRSNTDGSITVVGNTLNEESAKQILNLVRKLCLVPVHDQVVVKTR